MSDTVSTFTAALKEYYSSDVTENLIYKDNPFYQMVEKDTNFEGKPYYRVPLIWAPAAGISSQFSNAQSNASSSSNSVSEFQVSRVKTYSVGYIDSDLLLAAEGKASAFVSAAKVNVDGIITNLSRDTAIAMFRDGTGTRGRIATTSSVTTTVLTLSNASDVFNFEVGQKLDFCATTTGTKKAYGSGAAALTISGIDRDLGTLTFAGNVNDSTTGVPTIATSDYIFLQGDVASSGFSKLAGLSAWLPDAAPSATTFFGVDRSADTRLGGLRLDASGGVTILEAINKAVGKIANAGGRASHIFCSWGTYTNLVNSLEGKLTIIEPKEGEFGFTGIKVNTMRGQVQVFPDMNCDDSHMFVLQLDTWKLCSLKKDVHLIDEDGLDMQRAYNADTFEIRYRFSGGLACRAPGWNCSVKLA